MGARYLQRLMIKSVINIMIDQDDDQYYVQDDGRYDIGDNQ